MLTKSSFRFPVLLLTAFAVSCAPTQYDRKSEFKPTVTEFGDVSSRASGSAPEREAEYHGPAANELGRMKEFLELQRPRQGIVKTLKTSWGDVIDCVEISQQPALLRQGMQDHKLQLKPGRIVAEGSRSKSGSERISESAKQAYAGLPEICPVASVPIRQLTIDDLKRFRTLEDFLAKSPRRGSKGDRIFRPEDLPEAGPTDKHQYAVARQYVGNWGAESVLNVWKPYTESSKEFTLSQIWVARGSGSNLETVEAGWQKYKQKYGDWRSRLFIYFTPDNYGSGGCYNLDCGAFVQTSNSVYIGGGFTNYSSHDGSQYEIKLLWYKDSESGHWWLRYGDTWVGYYPRSKFDSNGLRSRGSRVTFGGEITDYRTGGHHTRTDMGSGYMPGYGWKWAAYQRAVRYVDTSNFYRRATGLSTIVSDDDCYDIDLQESTGSWEVYFYFGGWGYGTQCE